MAKAKKAKPIKVRKPMDPQTAQRIRRVIIHVGFAILAIAGTAAGLYYDKGYVEHQLAFPADPPKVVLKNQPVWMSDFLAEQIIKSAKPAGTHSAFDHQLLVDTHDILAANPWIRQVKQVRRAYGQKPGDTIEVDCEYRAPVALVRWGDYFWLVDGEGVKLPDYFTQQQIPRIVTGRDHKLNIRIVEGVKQPPPSAGVHWIGDDLAAGLELVKLLFGKPYAEEIVKVNVSNFAGRIDGRAAQLVLVTKDDTEVRWGRPISGQDDFFVEVSPAQKLAYMQAIYNEKRRVDGNQPWIDVRFDAVTYPTPQPQTANTDYRR